MEPQPTTMDPETTTFEQLRWMNPDDYPFVRIPHPWELEQQKKMSAELVQCLQGASQRIESAVVRLLEIQDHDHADDCYSNAV